MNSLPSMQPTGWFQVAWSSDLEVGQTKALRYFGTELVAFRDMAGVVSVLNAHCQHLGANLSVGGCVVDDGIQCPFHGWVWNGKGRNVRIPYEDKPNRARKIRSWPVTEINEAIYIWHDADQRAPLWEVPDALKVVGAQIAQRGFHRLDSNSKLIHTGVHVHPQVIAENAVDPHHFRFVHHTPRSPVVLRETVDEWSWAAKVGFGRKWSEGIDDPEDTRNTIEIYWSGIGLSFSGEEIGDVIRVTAVNPTPIDDSTSDIFSAYWIADDTEDYDEQLRIAKLGLEDDIAIWDHQLYMDPPGLSPSEAAGFRELRSWARSFYPEPAVAGGNRS